MSIKMTVKGNYTKTEKYLKRAPMIVSLDINGDLYAKIKDSCDKTINILQNETPVDTGTARRSWGYDIERSKQKLIVTIYNTDVEDGVNVILLIEYGHSTKNRSWVPGIHFVEPSIKNGFNDVLNDTWKELKDL